MGTKDEHITQPSALMIDAGNAVIREELGPLAEFFIIQGLAVKIYRAMFSTEEAREGNYSDFPEVYGSHR